MTIKLRRKSILVVSAISIGVVVCLSVWLVLRAYKADQHSAHEHATVSDNKPTNQPSPQQTQHSDKQPLTASEKVAQSIADRFKSDYHQAGGIANPNMEQLIEIMETPAFATFLEKRNGTHREWNDFLESQGFPVNRNLFSELFRHTFPTGTPADYEPEMRVKIAQMFLTTEPLEPQDAKQALLQRARVIAELMSPDTEESGRAWFVGQFGQDWDGAIMEPDGDIVNNPAFVWITDVQRKAASIVAAAEQAEGDTSGTQASAAPWDMSSVMESPPASHSETEMPTTLDTPKHDPMTDADIEAAIEESLTTQQRETRPNERSDTPGDIQTNLENVLKSQFSKDRFEQAMDTLETHGPEEGLRRLREHDPEIAKQIERHRKGKEVSK